MKTERKTKTTTEYRVTVSKTEILVALNITDSVGVNIAERVGMEATIDTGTLAGVVELEELTIQWTEKTESNG